MNKSFQILVGIIAVREGQFLVLQRSPKEKFMSGAWGIPAGKIHFGENLEAAALRELLEETGLHGTLSPIVGALKFFSKKDGQELHNLQINFMVLIQPGAKVTLDQSNSAFQWLPFEDEKPEMIDDFTWKAVCQGRSVCTKEVPSFAS